MFAHLCFIYSLGHEVIKRDLSLSSSYLQQQESFELVFISQIALQVQRKHPLVISLHCACKRRVWTAKSVAILPSPFLSPYTCKDVPTAPHNL